MEHTKDVLEIAHIAIIIGDHFADKMYGRFGEGYINTTEKLSLWAIEFYDAYKDVDWEKVLFNPGDSGFDISVCCWDDAIVDFCDKKIERLKF